MNNDVKGSSIQKNLEQFISEQNENFFKEFDLIIVNEMSEVIKLFLNKIK